MKLLYDLNRNKAACPDELKQPVLKELREVIAFIVNVIFQKSV